MAQTSWPFENIDTSETQFSLWARNLGQGVIDGRELELEPFADGSGMTVKVKSGDALVRGHYYASTVQETLNIAASDPSLARKDALVLRLDPTANNTLLHIVTGTPDASPSLPALTQTDSGIYELLIAEIDVPAGAVVIAAENVTDQRTIFQPWTGSVTIAAITGLQAELDAIDAAIAEKQDILAGVSSKTADYTLAASDTNDLVQVDGTVTITVPSSTFAAGARVDVVNIGTGIVTFAAGAGMTLNSKESLVTIGTQWAAATVFFTSATTAILIGEIA